MQKETLLGILLKREKYDKYYIYKFCDIIEIYKTEDGKFINKSGQDLYSYEDPRIIDKNEEYFIGETVDFNTILEMYGNDIKSFKDKTKENLKNIIYFGDYNNQEKSINISFIDLKEMYRDENKTTDVMDSKKLFVGISLANLEIMIDMCNSKKYTEISKMLKDIRDEYYDSLIEKMYPNKNIYHKYNLPQ